MDLIPFKPKKEDQEDNLAPKKDKPNANPVLDLVPYVKKVKPGFDAVRSLVRKWPKT